MSNEAKYAIARVEAALKLIREEAAYIAGYRAWEAQRKCRIIGDHLFFGTFPDEEQWR